MTIDEAIAEVKRRVTPDGRPSYSQYDLFDFESTIINAVASGELAKSGWQPIATAPRDGTKVDLWMVDQDGRAWREADAYYVMQGAYQVMKLIPGSGWERDGYAKRDGWCAPNHDYDGDDGWCDVPEFYNAHPRQMKTIFTLPTHWMPRPQPPEVTP